jgi:uracil-DNA glycosylase
MFVGNNLDAEVPYRRRLESGIAHGDRGRPMKTWRGLYQLLDAARVGVRNCFFTNAYVGLVVGEKPTGPFPGARDARFSSWCQEFLRSQIATMKPAVVVTIGGDARRFLGRLTGDLAGWSRASSMTIHHAEIDERSVKCVALAHPSMYPASARQRSFQGQHGVAADAALLRAAVATS